MIEGAETRCGPAARQDEYGALLETAVAAATAAGAELLARYTQPPVGVRAKQRPADLVSDADVAAERLIADVIADRRPHDGVLAEEGIADRAREGGLRWVVDPLDGTANFLTGTPLWCVSVACEDAAGTCVGVVFDPVRDELFSAARGDGAKLNGRVLRPSETDLLEAACVGGTVTCFTPAEAVRYGSLAQHFFQRIGQRRSLGSAALELAWTAAGRIDLCYQEQHIHPWDVDAGMLICHEAGLAVHRLAPIGDGLAWRCVVAPSPLVAPVLRHTCTSEP